MSSQQGDGGDRVKEGHSNIPGLIFVAFGSVFLLGSQSLNMGTISRMGPGYFPAALSMILIAIGLLQIDWRVTRWWAAMRDLAGRLRESTDLRPLALMSLAAFVFYLGIDRIGLAPTLAASGFVATYCFRAPTLLTRLLTALGIAVFVTLVFVQLLGLNVAVFRWSI